MLTKQIAFYLACSITAFGALVHILAPFIGEYWYSFMRAPSIVVLSSANGTLLAPISAICIGSAMFICSLYAVSAYKESFALPFQTPMLYAISFILLARGVSIVPIYLFTSYSFNTFDLSASALWFISGVGFLKLTRYSNGSTSVSDRR